MNHHLTTVALATALAVFSVAGAPALAQQQETPAFQAMDGVIGQYAALCAELAAGKLDTYSERLRSIAAGLEAVAKAAGSDGKSTALRALAKETNTAIAPLTAELRSGFTKALRPKLFALSKPLVRYVGRFRAGGKRWKTYYCPMAKGSWLQPAADEKLANPYYGGKMLRCGDPVRTRGE